jgi:hypothetical protein
MTTAVETLAALQASIEAWEKKLVQPMEDVRLGSEECPLCKIFAPGNTIDALFSPSTCAGCPVAAAVGLKSCEGTPYKSAAMMLRLWKRSKNPGAEADFRMCVEAEVDFLRSLLPAAQAAADGEVGL